MISPMENLESSPESEDWYVNDLRMASPLSPRVPNGITEISSRRTPHACTLCRKKKVRYEE